MSSTSFTLITGASSGIGAVMARLLATEKRPLILVARRIQVLQELKKELESKYAVAVVVIASDLSAPGAAAELYEYTRQQGYVVSTLINNAGVGLYGSFADTDLEQELKMIQLNTSALVALTKLYMQDMLAAKNGTILNVSSLLAFLPFPYYAVYSGTKAFVQAFTDTLAAEVAGTGIRILSVCPGPVDTPFQSDAMWKTNAYKANPPMDVAVVAAAVVAHLNNGTGKKVIGFNNWFISQLPRITPSGIMMRIKKHLASRA